jgi:hypothetical protein
MSTYPEDYASDPQKGQWGGHARRKDRELTARVVQAVGQGDSSFRVELTVQSLNAGHPLTGTVRFHLHPSFETPKDVPVERGIARLELLASAAFTVGAEADGGSTKLELDLAEAGDIPAHIRR